MTDTPPASPSPSVRRPLWLAGGVLWLAVGVAGIVLPLVPTVDCVALAAYCFARGDRRWEAWLLRHPRLGPMLADWRRDRALTMRTKCLATASLTASAAWAAATLQGAWAWIPAAVCAAVAFYLWTRPTRRLDRCNPCETRPTGASPN